MSPEPIPGLRAMAIVRWVILGTVAIIAASTWWLYAIDDAPHVEGTDAFYCPMHPQIRSSVPGTCPICFMKLEPIPVERTKPIGTHEEHAPAPGSPPSGLVPVMVTAERRQTVGISTIEVRRQSIARELRLPAVIEPTERAVSEVRTRADGFVERVEPVETGQQVRAGQPLVWISSPEIRRAQEELLAAQRASSSASFQAAVVTAAIDRLVLLGVDMIDIERIRSSGQAEQLIAIRAPMNGVVTARDVAVGGYATVDKTLFRVTDLSKVWVSATASADELAEIKPSARGRLVTRGRSYDIEAVLIEQAVSAETRNGRVRFVAQNTDGSLRPGAIGEVDLSLPAREHVLVPRDAVIDVGTVRYVFVERSAGLFAPRVVEPGPLLGEDRAIVRGLDAGERVVTRGAFLLDSESRLQAGLAPPDAGAAP